MTIIINDTQPINNKWQLFFFQSIIWYEKSRIEFYNIYVELCSDKNKIVLAHIENKLNTTILREQNL